MSITNGISVRSDSYDLYNRYVARYPINTLGRHGSIPGVCSMLTSADGMAMIRITPTMHAT